MTSAATGWRDAARSFCIPTDKRLRVARFSAFTSPNDLRDDVYLKITRLRVQYTPLYIGRNPCSTELCRNLQASRETCWANFLLRDTGNSKRRKFIRTKAGEDESRILSSLAEAESAAKARETWPVYFLIIPT